MIFVTHSLLFLTLGLFIMALLLFFILAIESLFRGHDLQTSRRATRELASTILRYKPDAKIIYDLGCAHGTLSLRLKKLFPYFEITAIDDSSIRILYAKLGSKILRRKINFKTQDIFTTDLSSADVVYAYLWYDHMPILERKLQKELKQGAIVITNTSHFKDWHLTEKVITYPKVSKTPDFETLFVYVKQ